MPSLMPAGYIADKSLGYAQSGVDVATLIGSLTFAGVVGLPAAAQMLLIQPQGQAIRWRDDGIAPTATVGYPLAVGAELRYTGSGMAALRVISQLAGAIVNVTAYG